MDHFTSLLIIRRIGYNIRTASNKNEQNPDKGKLFGDGRSY
jgi:hypothetical protein